MFFFLRLFLLQLPPLQLPFLQLTLHKPVVTSHARLRTLTAFHVKVLSRSLTGRRNRRRGPNNRDVIDFRPRSTCSGVPRPRAARSDRDTFPVFLVFELFFRSRTRPGGEASSQLPAEGHVALDSSPVAAEVSVTQKSVCYLAAAAARAKCFVRNTVSPSLSLSLSLCCKI